MYKLYIQKFPDVWAVLLVSDKPDQEPYYTQFSTEDSLTRWISGVVLSTYFPVRIVNL